ncbi:MAG TPA: GntR family transcriptional regulator [Gemmatimonadales bacterium]|nr:GntR family transcriptional regulator [Gemmatimonadales bacterium]
MFDQIDPRSPVPLYAQIASRLRLAIAAGEIATGVSLPSVRQLAARLRVNPATVVQAYRDLEAEGFVEMRQGAGTYVRDIEAQRRAGERADQAVALVRRMVADAGRMGLTVEELVAAIGRELEGRTS